MDELSLQVDSIVVCDDFSIKLGGIDLKCRDGLGLTESDACSYLDSYVKNISSQMHPRFNLYKKTFGTSNQEERRRHLLLLQKEKRQQKLDSSRVDVPDSRTDHEMEDHESPKSAGKKSQSKKWYHSNQQYKDLLMFSEWLEEVPSDFETSWIWAMCPTGKRCLVVAIDGATMVFNKGGKFICKHSSSLPGGNRDHRVDETILDCIYDETLRTYFILDCLVWKSHPITETESQFRFYWLQCKLEECPNLSKQSIENPYVFKNIPRFTDCTRDNLMVKLGSPFEFTLDGILFFHRESHYTNGHTPLVSWLKAYMLPEILAYPIPEWIMNTAPSGYPGARPAIKESINEIQKLKDTLNNRVKRSPKIIVPHVTSPSQKNASDDAQSENLEDSMEHADTFIS